MEEVGSPGLWIAFIALVIGLLALDLGVFHREDRTVRAREALAWTGIWVALALAFGGFVAWRFGSQHAVEYLTGYLLEKSLSLDNLFVFVLVFATFRIPPALQHRVLYWGILTALVLRGVMILAGAALLHRFHGLILAMGAFLVFTGVKLLRERGESPHPERTLAYRLLTRIVPSTPTLEGHAFLVRREGRLVATPLLLALLLVEVSDVVFAVDSIPAIFGVTLDPFLVFTSNVFAILGLRSLYFAIATLVGRFAELKVGLALVLLLIGLKMVLSPWLHVGPLTSLAGVVAVLSGSLAIGVRRGRQREAAAAGARAAAPLTSARAHGPDRGTAGRAAPPGRP